MLRISIINSTATLLGFGLKAAGLGGAPGLSPRDVLQGFLARLHKVSARLPQKNRLSKLQPDLGFWVSSGCSDSCFQGGGSRQGCFKYAA